jgi:hypothetical protein
VQTKKVIIRKKRGREADYQEIEIPTDEAMIDVAQRLHSVGEACNIDLDGWQVIYVPPQSVFSGPAWNPWVEGEAYGPRQKTGHIGARCGFGRGKWFAIFDWLTDDDSGPVKTSTTEGVLAGRPTVIQESLLDWRPKEHPRRAVSWESEPGDLESALAISGDELHEGARIRVTSDKYERDPNARKLCLRHHGAKCVVCGFDPAAIFGHAGARVIHVHHLRPLSSDGTNHAVDPIADLRPLCPNCHMFVHLRVPPLDVEEAKRLVEAIRALSQDMEAEPLRHAGSEGSS